MTTERPDAPSGESEQRSEGPNDAKWQAIRAIGVAALSLMSVFGTVAFVMGLLTSTAVNLVLVGLLAVAVFCVGYEFALRKRNLTINEFKDLLHENRVDSPGAEQATVRTLRDHFKVFLGTDDVPVTSTKVLIEGSIVGFSDTLPHPLADFLLSTETNHKVEVIGSWSSLGAPGHDKTIAVELFPVILVAKTLRACLETNARKKRKGKKNRDWSNLNGIKFRITWKPYAMIGASLILTAPPTKAVVTRAMSQKAIEGFLAGESDSRFWGTTITDTTEVGGYTAAFYSTRNFFFGQAIPRETWSLSVDDDGTLRLEISRALDRVPEIAREHWKTSWTYWDYDDVGKFPWDPKSLSDLDELWTALATAISEGNGTKLVRGEDEIQRFLKSVHNAAIGDSPLWKKKDAQIAQEYGDFKKSFGRPK